ncbi:hypothetical protein HWV62_7302, partial [Athelia sp. TMB]
SKSLAPSPELHLKSTTSLFPAPPSDGSEIDDYFSSPQPPRHKTHSSTSSSATLPTMIPRELPPPPDRQSVHYPGFDVLPDTHIPLLRVRSISVELSDPGNDPKRDKECCKENMAPRRRARKAVTAPEASELTRAGLTLPSGKQKEVERLVKAKSTPGTPNKTSTDRMASATPTTRRKGPAGTPVATPQERRQARRMLEEEADEAGGDEDMVNAML